MIYSSTRIRDGLYANLSVMWLNSITDALSYKVNLLFPTIKEVMYDNFDFIYKSASSLPNDVTLLDKKNMKEKYTAYYVKLTHELHLKFLSWDLIDRDYVMKPLTKTDKIIGLVAATAGIAAPILGIVASKVHEFPHIAAEIVHLFKEVIEVCEKGYDILHDIYHVLHEKKENFTRMNSVATCIELIGYGLTQRFQSRLLLSTPEICREMAQRHFRQIITVLETTPDTSTNFDAKIYRNIVNAIDPCPKMEIHYLIAEHILQEHRRYKVFYKTRLFIALMQAINEQNINFKNLSSWLHSKIIFIDKVRWKHQFFISEAPHSLILMNPYLGFENPCIDSLKDKGESDGTQVFENIEHSNSLKEVKIYEDGKPFLEPLFKKILLLVMNWEIKNKFVNPLNPVNVQAAEVISTLALTPVTKMLYKKLKKVNQKQDFTNEFLKQNFPGYSTALAQKEEEENVYKATKKNLTLKSNADLAQVIFEKPIGKYSNKLMDEILSGNLTDESLIEKIYVLFSLEQPFLDIEKTFRQLHNKSISPGLIYGTNSSLDESVRFLISTISFVAYKRDLDHIKDHNEKVVFQNFWKTRSRALRPLIDNFEGFFSLAPRPLIDIEGVFPEKQEI